jgi:hypothetical protein
MYNGINAFARLNSSEGVKQGDPLGGFLFALTLQPVLKSCVVGEAKILSFMDDSTVVGPTVDCLRTFNNMSDELPKIGLRLREDKCKILPFNDPTNPTPFAIQSAALEQILRDPVNQLTAISNVSIVQSIVVLGYCITDDESIFKEWIKKIVSEKKELMEQLTHNAFTTQVANLLLRLSVLPSLDFIMRLSLPQFQMSKLYDSVICEFDECVRQTFVPINNLSSDAESRSTLHKIMRIARNPIHLGGMGIVSKQIVQPIAAYLSSLRAIHDILRLANNDISSPLVVRFKNHVLRLEQD